jgi:hypothetical protein
MSEQEDQQSKQDRSIDALAAMADGQDLWPDAEDKPATPPSAQPSDLPEGGVQPIDLPEGGVQPFDLSAAGVQPSPEEIEARRARAQALRSRTRQAHAHHFRNLMIPMLLVTAVLLLLLATIAAFMLPSPEEAQMNSDNLLGRPWARYLIYAAFPLALILLVAAGIFWQDLRRSRIKTNISTENQ